MKKTLLLICLLVASNGYHLVNQPPAPVEGEIVFVADNDYFPTALELIESADESIHVGAFELKHYEKYPDSQTNQLLQAMADARARDVQVSAVTDEFLNQYDNDANRVVRLLRQHGIDARLDGPEKTMHAKVLVIDERYVLLGSTNWSFTSLTKNHEANVLVNSPELAADVIDYLDSM